ncbi:MAG: DNA polymerase III subunit delta [Vampirovibrio sp.]|nr:DNA polymerase III subunit delta [Vampirovibrio sp.]
MPVYIYYGDEDYLREQAVLTLRNQVVNPALGALSHKTLKTPNISEVMEAVDSVSLALGGDSLVEIIDFAYLGDKAVDDAAEKQLEQLKTSLTSVTPTKHVLFVSRKVDRKRRFPKWITGKGVATVQEFKQLPFWKTDEVSRLVVQQAQQEGVKIAPDAAALLVDGMGVAMQPLMNEVRKLGVYTGGQPVTAAHVKMISNYQDNVFELLADWVTQKRPPSFFETLDDILMRQNPVQLFALTQTFLNNIFKLRYWQQLGVNQAEMASRTKKNPYKVKLDLEAYQRVPMDRLTQLKEKVLEFEWKAKTGQLESRTAFETLMAS